MALIAVVIFTALCFVAMLILAFALPDKPNPVQTDVASTITKAFVAGLGALIGLIGGKAT